MPFAPLLAALAEVRDPRRAQGQRYGLRHLLLFSVLAVLAGAISYQGIITFIALQRERLNAVFGAGFRRAPAVNTLRHLFLALGRDDLEAAFRRHARGLSARAMPEAMRTVALDGKTPRGSVDHPNDRPAAHVRAQRLRQRCCPHPGASGTGRRAGRDRGGAEADGRARRDRRAVHRRRPALSKRGVRAGR